MQDAESRLSYILGDATEIPKSLATDKESPLVGIIMGSDSDLPVMAVGARILKQLVCHLNSQS